MNAATYDLAAAKLGLAVPAGSYQLFAGQVGQGSKLQKMKALVLPAKNAPPVTVRPGETATFELGAPFTFDFSVHQDATKLTVVGDSIAIKGKGGETYQRLWNCVVRPEVFTREAGKKRGSKGESMKAAESQQEVARRASSTPGSPSTSCSRRRTRPTSKPSSSRRRTSSSARSSRTGDSVLDVKFLRENVALVKAGAEKKRIQCDVDRAVELDAERRKLGQTVDELRARQKNANKDMATTGPAARTALQGEQRALKEELKGLEGRLKELEAELEEVLLTIPNVPSPEVPEGRTDADNVEVRRVGEPPAFDFAPLDHIDLGTRQGWLDIEAGARLSGSRNYVLKGELAILESGIMRFALDHMIGRASRRSRCPCSCARRPCKGRASSRAARSRPTPPTRATTCSCRDGGGAVTSLHAGRDPRAWRSAQALRGLDELLPARGRHLRQGHEGALPRAPVPEGRAGRDRRGGRGALQVAPPRDPRLLRGAAGGLRAPYRVVNVCGGDLGAPQVQKFDIETWMPGREAYGETHSASRFHDYQARRLKLRYRDADKKVRFCHTLNNTVAASTRLLIALLENHQQPDGRVRVPKALAPHVGGRTVLGRSIR
jgi:seryl-tRNA synthetase